MIGAIVLNGERYLGEISGDYIIATDGGYNKCARCDLVVGDMDSIVGLADVPAVVLNRDKDWTDGEYAVRLMIEKGVDRVNIYGLDGGRLDHILANIGLMSQLAEADIEAVCYANGFIGYMVTDSLTLNGIKGRTVSLSPYSDSVHIMRMKGYKWTLTDYTVRRNQSLTVSNIVTDDTAYIEIADGQLLVIVNSKI